MTEISKAMKYDKFYLKPKSLSASPGLTDFDIDSVKIPYNLIPITDTVESKNDEMKIYSNIPSRRQSKVEISSNATTHKRLSIKSEIGIQIEPEKNEPEIDIFKIYDYPRTECKQILENILVSYSFQIILNLFTIWCLFADDFKLLFLPKYPGDTIFNIINIICIALFLLEIIGCSMTRKKYFLSFFFWMDLISTFIIVFDLSWVQETIMTSQSSVNSTRKIPSASLKIMKIIRLIRLIRLLKLFKSIQEKKRKQTLVKLLTIDQQIREVNSKLEHRKTRNSIGDLVFDRQKSDKLKEEKERLLIKETRIGNKILENTVKRAIVMVLILVFCGPLFTSSFYYDDPKGYTIDLKILSNFCQENMDNSSTQQFYDYYLKTELNATFPLIYCNVSPLNLLYSPMNVDDFRVQEKEIYTISTNSSNQISFTSVIDLRSFSKVNALLNIIRTVYVAIVLLLTCVFFHRDLNRYVITPLTRMIININKIANNPLASKETIVFTRNKVMYETELIEEAILKTGILLALGFGEAGSFVISQNISNEGDLVATMPGKKTCAIFGFCDIRNFTDTTEILQEEVMVFVNSIAEVVHNLTDRYGGSANKNIGDAFLLVWKFPKSEIDNSKDSLLLRKSRIVENTTDLALIAFVKIICEINKAPQFLKYRSHPGLNGRLPNYQIKMGFGLHLGWAIEGSIGSEFKIDASYLSPNVNMAARLEAATKQYRSLLLISNDFMEYASKETREYCREIDRVTVKGSMKPVGLFTIDMDLSKIEINRNEPNNKRKSLMLRKSIREKVINPSEQLNELFETDIELIKVLWDCKGKFKELFTEAFNKYIEGDWTSAKHYLQTCLEMRTGDGPSIVLMGVMEAGEFKKPTDWQGFRILTEK